MRIRKSLQRVSNRGHVDDHLWRSREERCCGGSGAGGCGTRRGREKDGGTIVHDLVAILVDYVTSGRVDGEKCRHTVKVD